MSGNTMYAGRIFDAEVIAGAGGTATSAAIRMDSAVVMSLQTQVATTAGSINVAYTYALSSDRLGPFVEPIAPVTIATATALDTADFAPEASKYIQFTATNNDASPVTLTTVLNMQED